MGTNAESSRHGYLIALGSTVCAAVFLACVAASGQSVLNAPAPSAQLETPSAAAFDPVKFQQDREAAKRAVEEQVRNETLEESLRNLWLEPLSIYHCPLNDPKSSNFWPAFDTAELMRGLAKDPRVAKVLEISEHGTDAEKKTILVEATHGLEQMINCPAQPPIVDGRVAPSLRSQNGSVIYPLLLLRVEPRADSMQLLVRVSDCIQSVSRSERPKITGEDLARLKDLFPGGIVPSALPNYMYSGLGDVAAFAVRHMLDRYCDSPDMLSTLSPERQRRLDVYRAYRERVRAKIEAKRAEELNLSPQQLLPVQMMDPAEAHYWELAAREAEKPAEAAYAKLDPQELIFALARALVTD